MNKSADLHLAFDVGHSSIGWAVLQARIDHAPELLGCGAVIFPADDCLAAQRRQFRRQRRHIRSTRLRIARMKNLLLHLGVLTRGQLDKVSSSCPWLLAARVLAGGEKLSWPELWDVLRWYAHNRGYDGNKAWSRHEEDAAAAKEDTEKVETARALMNQHGTRTMSETWCKVCGLDPLGPKRWSHSKTNVRPKGLNAAFPREDVETEVLAVLAAHRDVLPQVTDAGLIAALMRDWRAVPCEAIRLPARFRGGLLFGQLVPRFENRIIATCPITFEHVYQRVLAEDGDVEKAKHEAEKLAKVPAADCGEFFRYRWAMQVANVLVQAGPDGGDCRATAPVAAAGGAPALQGAAGGGTKTSPRRLGAAERRALDARMAERGAMTKSEFAKAIEDIAGKVPSNVKQMLLHPDADKALVVDRARRELTRKDIAPYFAALPGRLQKRLPGLLRRGASLTLGAIREQLEALGDTTAFDAVLAREVEGAETKRGRKTKPVTREDILARSVELEPISGRAPHSREVMRAVIDFVFSTDRHPAEEGGPLYRSDAIRAAQLARAIDEQTNNHLVRHRLRLLERLHADLLKTYSGGDPTRIANLIIEVNRDLKELSAKTAQDIKKELGLRMKNFNDVQKTLEAAGINVRGRSDRAGLLRKARVLHDLSQECPYTGHKFDWHDLLNPQAVDKDHIIPRSQRPSDSLDSLVITFKAINKWKDQRTALRFMIEEEGKPVPGLPGKQLRTLAQYRAWVDGLLPKSDPRPAKRAGRRKGPIDDDLRRWRRKELLLLDEWVGDEFLPRDLTQTSQLVRLGAEALERVQGGKGPKPISMPGSVTGAVRKSWKLLGCLSAANSQILAEDGSVRTKTDIRDITHLHHALDACVLAFATVFLPGKGRDGGAWKLLVQRRLSPEERALARDVFGPHVEFDVKGNLRIVDIPNLFKEQIRTRLAERRVVQHLPAEWGGLPTKETICRVFDPSDPHPNAQRLARWLAEKQIAVPSPEDSTVILIYRKRKGGEEDGESGGSVLRDTPIWRWIYQEVEKSKVLGLGDHGDKKLRAVKGGKLIADNYGLALFPDAPKGQPQYTPIRFFRVWEQIEKLPRGADGKRPPILRRGHLVTFARGKFAGKTWRILGIEENGRIRFFEPDKVRRIDKPENYQKRQIGSLLRDGLMIFDRPPLCGLFVG